MREEKRAARESQIIEAAYALLEEKGAAGMSMLAVAKAAKASNETLYNWYGDKLGLFRAMALRNGEAIAARLEAALVEEASPLETLDALGPLLLNLLTGPRAVALARAAAGDATGALGAALAEVGRARIAPMIEALCQRALDERALRGGSAGAICETYLGLLLGDLQIRRVIHAAPPLQEAEIRSRADRALMATWRLYAREESGR
ncbi:TetR/AcrR family transcriptional regulator [Oceanicola sp. D3]|uniref:TetR/AcrR family transcriptional regulator n=1 Tax=Oceanicola sp. D3 TaxID=2587163 RepID=UPI0011236F26|nr:TetR/AcrR family transcriptional regulator [Oceanicola sp. D3]QDC07850.1 TetR/AcrR family transcriptional regulator [Oceanicola sp. D3]